MTARHSALPRREDWSPAPSSTPPPPCPCPPRILSCQWLTSVYCQDLLSRLEEVKTAIMSDYGWIPKVDSTKKVVYCMDKNSNIVYIYAVYLPVAFHYSLQNLMSLIIKGGFKFWNFFTILMLKKKYNKILHNINQQNIHENNRTGKM